MSDKEKERIDTDSVTLFSYLKQEIPVEDIRDYASPRRIKSIDFVKGFAIVFIIIAHSSGAWLDSDWVYIHGMAYAVLDILGPSLFIFLSALSVVFSIKRKEGILPDNVIRTRILTRGIVIAIIGILFNIVSIGYTIEGVPFPLSLWGWNILVFIGFSQIFAFYALKLSHMSRIISGALIIFVSEDLRSFLFLTKDSNILSWFMHYIITSPAPSVTLFPWLGICFISTIFGEMLYEAMIKGPGDAYHYIVRLFLTWGLLFIFFGMWTGRQLETAETMARLGGSAEYWHFNLFSIMNQQNYYQFPGMPNFLIRGTASSMWYNLGWSLLIIAISFYFIDIKGKQGQFIRMIQYYGKTSLSLFLIHFMFLPLFVAKFNIAFFVFVCLTFIGFLGFFMYFWMEYADGKGSPEWMMIQIGRVGQKTGEGIKKEGKKIVDKTKDTFKKVSKTDNHQ